MQDAIKVEQQGGAGKFELPSWDQAGQKKVRDALLVLAGTLPDTKGMFGKKGEVDPNQSGRVEMLENMINDYI